MDYFFILIAIVFLYFISKYTFKAAEYISYYKNSPRISKDLVFMKVCTPKKESREDKEIDRESRGQESDFKGNIALMSQLINSLSTLHDDSLKARFKGRDYLSFEIVVLDGMINLYILAPSNLAKLIEKKVTAFFPDSFIDYDSPYKLISKDSYTKATYMTLKKESIFPLKSFRNQSNDPFNFISNSLSKFEPGESAAIQLILTPEDNSWSKEGRKKAKEMLNKDEEKKKSFLHSLKILSFIGKFFEFFFTGTTESSEDSSGVDRKTQVEEDEIKAMDEKNTQSGFDTNLRIVVNAKSESACSMHIRNIKSAFSQFSSNAGNSFGGPKSFLGRDLHSEKALIKNYLLRSNRKPFFNFFDKSILSSDEIAMIFHVPNISFNRSPNLAWQNYKIAPPPDNLPKDGILLGYNYYRGEKKEVRLKPLDRFRHFYVIGQTGTGKSSIMQVMIRQDFMNGKGLCIIDPHGTLIEDVLPFIPRSRADDVVLFNPSDTERPMGLNLLEAKNEDERELVAMDAMNLMIKIFDEEIFGPRLQDYFRNGCLTLMEYDKGGAITDIVRLFTDEVFQKERVDQVTNPIVKSFWENQMANTSQEEKQRIIPYFAAKFAAFITNKMMRNIIGQVKSGFDFLDAMQNNKILLMNLSKGLTGEFNSKLLGLIIVSKLQVAALSREKIPKDQRQDFFLYIDEFQNYITDSIESILSEARKYKLGLVVAHQYIGQLVNKGDEKIKNAIFGNVGSMFCYKVGAPDAEFLKKEFEPTFSDQDLINIDKFKGVMKLSIDTQPSKPFSIVPINPYLQKGDKEIGEAMRQLSRLKYGRDVEFVNREILRRIGT